MSFLATAWAEEAAPTADVYERMILMCMAARADHDGSGVYRSIPRLARSCHCDEETVKRRLKAMLKRKLIGYGDQARAAHIDKRYRPKVYDLLIPHEWFSAQQLALVNQDRAESGLRPLNPADRLAIDPAPARRKRADQGVPNPKRSPKRKPTSVVQTALSEPSADLVDNSPGGSERAVLGGSLSPVQRALSEPQIRPYESVLKKSFRPEAREEAELPTHELGAPETVGRTDDFLNPEATDADSTGGPVGESGATLIAAQAIQEDLHRIDLLPAAKPHQRKQLMQLTAAVDRALLRFPVAKVACYLEIKAREANTVTWLTRAFSEFGDAIKDVQVAYRSADHQPVDDILGILSETTPYVAGTDVTNRSLVDVEQTEHQTSSTTQVEPATSPVTWLTDQQFAALSPQDRAHVRTAGDTPVEELRPIAAKRITAIRRTIAGVAA